MRWVFIILISINLYAVDLEQDWKHLSKYERNTILTSYTTGLKYDLGYTLAAICWQESKGGRWQIPVDNSSKDYGLYHINIKWYLKELKVKNTMWNRSKFATILLTQPDIAETYVINKLLLLKKTYKSYYKVWWRYNGSEKYAKLILAKVRFLEKKLLK